MKLASLIGVGAALAFLPGILAYGDAYSETYDKCNADYWVVGGANYDIYQTLKYGDAIDYKKYYNHYGAGSDEINFEVKAYCEAEDKYSIHFTLYKYDGQKYNVYNEHCETSAPYHAFGSGAHEHLPPGDYKLYITSHTGDTCDDSYICCYDEIKFYVPDCYVERFVIWDVSGKDYVQYVEEGDKICLDPNKKYSIEAYTDRWCSDGVSLYLEGELKKERNEYSAPYFLFSNRNGYTNFNGVYFPYGDYKVYAYPIGWEDYGKTVNFQVGCN